VTAALTPAEVLALPALIDVPAVAAAFGGIGTATVYREVSSGRFPIEAVRVGARLLFRRSDLTAFLGLDGPRDGQQPPLAGPHLALVDQASASPRAG